MQSVHAVLVGLSATLASCGGGVGEEAPSLVFRSLESRQCEGGGKSLAELRAVLVGAGVQVISASCGVDGQARIALCGTADGRIGIFEVPLTQVQPALAAGFPSLAGVPFERSPC